MLVECGVRGVEAPRPLTMRSVTETAMAVEQFTKACRKCGEVKPLALFPKAGTGHRPRCKPCHTADSMAWQTKNHDLYIKNLRAWYDKNQRRQRVLLTEEERSLRKRIGNKKWAENNKERLIQIRKDWVRRNKHVEMERVRRRQAAKLRATPDWANKERMREFYARALEKTAETGEKWSVDHIVPLISKIVCGLHCEANLQLLQFGDNVRKGNRHWPDMP